MLQLDCLPIADKMSFEEASAILKKRGVNTGEGQPIKAMDEDEDDDDEPEAADNAPLSPLARTLCNAS